MPVVGEAGNRITWNHFFVPAAQTSTKTVDVEDRIQESE
jgi:hypothetical protein